MKRQWNCHPFQPDPSWYDRCWLTSRPEKPSDPTKFILIAFAVLRGVRLRPLIRAPRQVVTLPEIWMQFQ